MKRRLFTLASALSLLLCLAIVTLWVRSYFVSDVLVRNGPLPRGRYELSHEVPGVIGQEMREVATTRGAILILHSNVSTFSPLPSPALLPWRHFAEFPPLRSPQAEFYPTAFRNGSLTCLSTPVTPVYYAAGVSGRPRVRGKDCVPLIGRVYNLYS